ncbi:MAG TPA: Arm DNA-binding domain-containing protein [Steroidobacteraceae bacterium]|nr:Arm DNA-binding domain-containing protein [Steroidobacteraceae bacterium]
MPTAACKNAKPKATPYKKSDGGGLYLLVKPRGAKLWQLAYRHDGRQKTYSIGGYPIVPLADARTERDKAKALIVKGIDPVLARQTAAPSAKAARPSRKPPTVGATSSTRSPAPTRRGIAMSE